MKQKRDYPYSDVPSVMQDDSLSIFDMISKPSESIELEIGFGKGRFVLGRAEANPSIAFVGLETRRKWVHLVTERAQKHKIENVRVWLGDAKTALPKIKEDACVDRVFINFPDPWWKERHAKRMVVADEVIVEVVRLLKDGGQLFVQTDVDFRAEYYLKTISLNKDLEPVHGDGMTEKNPFGSRTLREVHCEEVSLPIFRILFSRKPRT